MHWRLKQGREGESGQVTAWFVGTAILLFGIIALAYDVGSLFHARRMMQNAADPASFAGAAYLGNCSLAGEPPGAIAAAEDYVERNWQGTFGGSNKSKNVQLGEFTFTDEFGTVTYDTVYSHVTRSQRYLFGSMLGLTSSDVPAEAEAACLPTAGANICPFFLRAEDPEWTVEDGGDPFGLIEGEVYRFKVDADSSDSGNRGFLGIYGQGINNLANGIENGCVPDDPELDIYVEGGDTAMTDPQPGNAAQRIWDAIDDLYSYEGTGPYEAQDYCDIEFDPALLDTGDPDELYEHVTPSDPLVDEKLVACKDDPNPQDNVVGRWWPIAITSTPCGGSSCDVPILSVALMYVACWGPRCDGSPPGQAAIYGIFIDAVPFDLPSAGGISNSPLTPQRVRLVQ